MKDSGEYHTKARWMQRLPVPLMTLPKLDLSLSVSFTTPAHIEHAEPSQASSLWMSISALLLMTQINMTQRLGSWHCPC